MPPKAKLMISSIPEKKTAIYGGSSPRKFAKIAMCSYPKALWEWLTNSTTKLDAEILHMTIFHHVCGS